MSKPSISPGSNQLYKKSVEKNRKNKATRLYFFSYRDDMAGDPIQTVTRVSRRRRCHRLISNVA